MIVAAIKVAVVMNFAINFLDFDRAIFSQYGPRASWTTRVKKYRSELAARSDRVTDMSASFKLG
ncbi:hypothetical protein [Celeribacter halophilus]|uniref:hypothetical protein n=1 Tax=Celeribacter halophilus TaxID=576117 RepID=UPI003A8E14B6